ncbi:hypothetical protein BGW37DRAFT_522609 [Umbelopsis sp. PMI_123]|nr:hypothetical protein BGW37DRAFT_522609 [Umbelopsis sp. PMI_123]
MSRDVPVLSNNACAPIVRRGLLAGFYGSLIVGSVVLTGIFSYQLIKAYKYRRDSVLRVIFISSAVCAILSGLSQITFSLVILFKPIPEKYDLILIKSDMTINVLITVSFVHRVMQESRQSSARSSMQSAMQSPPQKPQLSKSLERQLENAESGTLQLATTSHSSDGIPRY